MAQIQVSEEHYTRLVEFEQEIETVLGQEITFQRCVEIVIEQGLKSMLADITPEDPTVLMHSLQGLAEQHPAEVYKFVSETLRTGTSTLQKQRLRQRIGFSAGRSAEGSEHGEE